MAIFNRRGATDAGPASKPGGPAGGAGAADNDTDSVIKEKKPFAQRKPANTAFKQQRLKAWQPILTPRSVLPTFFVLGLIFAPIGAVLYYFSSTVSELTIDYTECISLPLNEDQAIPSSKYSYQLHDISSSNFQQPRWTRTGENACQVFFWIPTDLDPPLFLYYKLTNYYQNHRRYVKSLDTQQLLGEVRTADDLQGGQCKPVGKDDATGKAIYPCGLIANSVFNDTFGDPILLTSSTSQNVTYAMSERGIVWPGEKDKYKRTTMDPSQLIPPPYWRGATGERYGKPSGEYFANGSNLFDPSQDEHFMVWMRTAGLPTFRKLYKRNDADVLRAGYYRLDITDNYPVTMFKGTKSIVISTVSWVGGRNPFLGIAYIVVAGLLILLGLVFTANHLVRPRRLGDMSLLSWNAEEGGR
ncbi:Lem3/Cdc50 [Jaminaea rosea]|uniref:Lem3/Cdc50 n=1 Tax=Jaminaea rosea TaxID=1569628 RepID=A0A316UXL7_9BASI|nr:Lem3/Cdc50 [Jaminaea rosea]PWN27885.1 Lem3/Cdc50 [Jaminaea rosea]